MVFHGNDRVVSGSCSFQQCCSIDRANAEQINYANRDPLPLQLVIYFQGFCERDASAYNGDDVLIALTKHFRSPTFELLVISVDGGLLRTSGADVGNAVVGSGKIDRVPRTDRIAGIEHDRFRHSAEEAQIFQAHLRGAVFTNGYANVCADELHVEVSETGKADEIGGTREEAGERRSEGNLAGGCEAHRCSDHVLLGDVHLEETIGSDFLEELGVSGVLNVPVGTDNVLVRLANLCERMTHGFASRDFLAEFVLRSRYVFVRPVLFGFAGRLAWHGLWSICLYELLFQFGNCFLCFVFL